MEAVRLFQHVKSFAILSLPLLTVFLFSRCTNGDEPTAHQNIVTDQTGVSSQKPPSDLVTICHKPGTPTEKTLVVPAQALADHLGHGDFIGSCEQPPPNILYSEDFSSSAMGWIKTAGPGLLEAVNGVFEHTTFGFSVWCEYAYELATFGDARHEIDVFVESQALNTSFVWRVPNLQIVTGNGGAYQARFNNSSIAPGPPGHFILEKFDPLGRTILLDIDNSFIGLNRLLIDDRGNSVSVSINGVHYGTIDVTHLSPPQAGYIVLVGGDRSGGDFFDNVKISGY